MNEVWQAFMVPSMIHLKDNVSFREDHVLFIILRGKFAFSQVPPFIPDIQSDGIMGMSYSLEKGNINLVEGSMYITPIIQARPSLPLQLRQTCRMSGLVNLPSTVLVHQVRLCRIAFLCPEHCSKSHTHSVVARLN